VRRAVLFDFGGVILTSPFEAFAKFENRLGLPAGFLRRVNATNPDANAWARLERGELSVPDFSDAFAEESESLGHRVPGSDVLALLGGDLRPQMVAALRRITTDGRFVTAMLTNNFLGPGDDPASGPPTAWEPVLDMFDAVIESSRLGVRKPDRRFYELACEELGIDPHEAVFLDDLGVNLKPAREMGMATIKVVDPDVALAELAGIIGLELDGPTGRPWTDR
jgi:putative hydrolase of the HAD superfamily